MWALVRLLLIIVLEIPCWVQVSKGVDAGCGLDNIIQMHV